VRAGIEVFCVGEKNNRETPEEFEIVPIVGVQRCGEMSELRALRCVGNECGEVWRDVARAVEEHAEEEQAEVQTDESEGEQSDEMQEEWTDEIQEEYEREGDTMFAVSSGVAASEEGCTAAFWRHDFLAKELEDEFFFSCVLRA
jgi:hypothetical protein